MNHVLIVLTAFVAVSSAADYNYRRNDTEFGPSAWNTKYSTHCSGKRQSPIDIDFNKTEYKAFESFKFTNLESIPSGPSLQIGNNNYSYRVYLKKDYFHVEGGGLPGKFNLFSFHFHWGADNSKGSEHTLKGKKYPAELHIVTYNTKYSDIYEALKNEDGIAALGVMLEIGTENPALTAFLGYTGQLEYSKELYNITQTRKLSELFPSDKSAFYRYDGSLTTPSCPEIVTWTVFKDAKTITNQQLDALRSLKDANPPNGMPLVDTYRPVQPLNDRTVYRSFDKSVTSSAGRSVPTSTLSLVLGILAILY